MFTPEPRWAEGLLLTMHSDEDARQTVAVLTDLLSVFEAAPELCGFLANPGTPAKPKKEVVRRLLEPGVPKQTVNFLQLLIDKGRLKLLPRIVTEYSRLLAKREDVLPVEVLSTEPLAAAELDSIAELCRRQTGAVSVSVKNHVDPSLIGGVRVLAGGFEIDYSLAGRLKRLKQAVAIKQ